MMTDYGYGPTHILAGFPFSLNNYLAANIFFFLDLSFLFVPRFPAFPVRSRSSLSPTAGLRKAAF